MDNINTILYTGLKNYFNVLFEYGEISLSDTNKLLVLKHIRDLSASGIIFSEEQRKLLHSVIKCLTGTSCLLEVPKKSKLDNIVQNPKQKKSCDTDIIKLLQEEYLSLKNELSNKQDILIAGNNITIEDNVISSSGSDILYRNILPENTSDITDGTMLVLGNKWKYWRNQSIKEDSQLLLKIKESHNLSINDYLLDYNIKVTNITSSYVTIECTNAIVDYQKIDSSSYSPITSINVYYNKEVFIKLHNSATVSRKGATKEVSILNPDGQRLFTLVNGKWQRIWPAKKKQHFTDRPTRAYRIAVVTAKPGYAYGGKISFYGIGNFRSTAMKVKVGVEDYSVTPFIDFINWKHFNETDEGYIATLHTLEGSYTVEINSETGNMHISNVGPSVKGIYIPIDIPNTHLLVKKTDGNWGTVCKDEVIIPPPLTEPIISNMDDIICRGYTKTYIKNGVEYCFKDHNEGGASGGKPIIKAIKGYEVQVHRLYKKYNNRCTSVDSKWFHPYKIFGMNKGKCFILKDNVIIEPVNKSSVFKGRQWEWVRLMSRGTLIRIRRVNRKERRYSNWVYYKMVWFFNPHIESEILKYYKISNIRKYGGDTFIRSTKK